MLGVDQTLKFSQTAEGLKVEMPDRRPCEYAYALKIV
jgi:alpha-L-fucosidase